MLVPMATPFLSLYLTMLRVLTCTFCLNQVIAYLLRWRLFLYLLVVKPWIPLWDLKKLSHQQIWILHTYLLCKMEQLVYYIIGWVICGASIRLFGQTPEELLKSCLGFVCSLPEWFSAGISIIKQAVRKFESGKFNRWQYVYSGIPCIY